MTSKIKRIILITIFTVILAVAIALFSACSIGVTVESLKNTFQLSAHVVYHANGGTFGNYNYADLYFPEGVNAVYITDDGEGDYDANFSVQRSKYKLSGWYYPATDSNGDIIYIDKDKDIAKLGEKFDFENTILQKNQEIHLYAKWIADQKLEILLAPDDSINNQLVYNDKTYNVGDILNTWDFEETGKVKKITVDPMTGKSAPDGYVFAEYYTDESCTTPVSWPIDGSDSGENVKIYAKYLSSNWKIISKSVDLYQLFVPTNGVVSDSFFIKNDVTYIGYLPLSLYSNTIFSGEIRGNGFTISNLKLSVINLGNNQNASMFGTLVDGAKISNLTIGNASVSISGNLDNAISTYFLFYKCEEGASLDNVVIDGGSLEVTINGLGSWNGSTEESDICPIIPNENEGVIIKNEPSMKVRKQ